MSGIWTEHRNAEGRTYWFNTTSKESVWEKPDVLRSSFEKALGQTKWKEYFSGGRKYYYNTDTKESKWDMPDELLLLLEKVEKESQPAPLAGNMITPAFAPSENGVLLGSGSEMSPTQHMPNGGPNALAVGAHTGGMPFISSGALPGRPSLPDDPAIPHNGFATIEEGEKAFAHLLRKAGVDATWTWDQTMRAIITDPLYKALNTLAEKKNAWQKYVDGLKEKEREEREARLAKTRPAIRNMLKGNPNVHHYSTFPTADRLFSQHPIWQQSRIESERRMIFEEYVSELKQRELQESRANRARSISKVVSLFKELHVDVLTRWRTAHAALLESDDWQTDPELQKLPTLDILLAFEDCARVQEREFEDRMRRETVEKTRKERKVRDAFKTLLRELLDAGKIVARSKWKDVYPLFADDERYLNLLGNPGSNPLELFWDVVDNLDQKLDDKMSVVEEAIRNLNKQVEDKSVAFDFGPGTTEDEFLENMVIAQRYHDNLQSLTQHDLKEVYHHIHMDVVKKAEAEKRRAERKQRHMQDDLRYALKKLPNPIDVNISYEDAIPLMEQLSEYKALEDEGRRSAFNKFIKRQKERLRERDQSEDGGSTTSRRRKEPKDIEREKERERDRDQDSREDGSASKHHRRGHELDHESKRDREYRNRDRDREYRDKDRDKDRDRDRDRDRDGYRSRYREREHDRVREKSERDRGNDEYDDREERRRDSRRLSRGRGSEGQRVEDSRYVVVHEGEKRERDDKSVYSDRSEKRMRYDSVEPPRGAPPAREETPEEGEI